MNSRKEDGSKRREKWKGRKRERENGRIGNGKRSSEKRQAESQHEDEKRTVAKRRKGKEGKGKKRKKERTMRTGKEKRETFIPGVRIVRKRKGRRMKK